jgi:hypothetical protein
MNRRAFFKSGAVAGLAAGLPSVPARADVPEHLFEGYDFGFRPTVSDRLDQGPFAVSGDRTVTYTTVSDDPVRNYGLGMVGYTWEENGPALAVRAGKETIEQGVDKLASLPFMDILYIRCDWRDIQTAPGKLNLNPVWKATMDAAKAHNLRVGFRIQLSSPNFQPKQVAIPDFLKAKVPMVKVGTSSGRYGALRNQDIDYMEPKYDHPEFQKAFREMNELLAAELDSNPLVEFMDLMMYGWWGEAHTLSMRGAFPDLLTAERTFTDMTRFQLDTWKRTPLAVNTQPDDSHVGNRAVQDMAVRAGCWLRSDSIIGDEPLQIEQLANRPPWCAVIMEDGGNRHHDITAPAQPPSGGGPFTPGAAERREKAALHCLDLKANYWALWTEADNLRRFYEKFPRSFDVLKRRMGYRIRPSWVWQRQRNGATELVVAITNDGVSGIPGVLRLNLEGADGKLKLGGGLDAGHPYGGGIRLAAFVLPKGTEDRKFTLRAEVETKMGVRHPVRFACAEPLNPDGSFTFDLASNRRG